MKKLLNKGTISFLLLSLFSCSSTVPSINTDPEIVRLQQAGIDTARIFVAEVSKNKGASIYLRIDSKIPPNLPLVKGGDMSSQLPSLNPPLKGVAESRGMSVKANSNGTAAIPPTDIDHFLVYLIKNASATGFPAGGNPLADVVAGPFNISKTTSSTELIRFDGLPASAGDAYYVAVRARDSSNNDLIKDNNGSATAWTSANKKIAVSSGNGIVVGNNLQVSSTASLSVTPNLADATGAVLEAEVTPANGTIPSSASNTLTIIPASLAVFAGTGNYGYSGDGSDASLAELFSPNGIEFDRLGNLYIADSDNAVVRKVGTDGKISTFAGGGVSLGDNDIPATDALFYEPSDIAVDSAGNIYISDNLTGLVRKVGTDGKITTVAGNLGGTVYNDGLPATQAALLTNYSIAVDNDDNLYISCNFYKTIRKVGADGIITTVAGIPNSGGFSGDGSDATDAQLNSPFGIAVDDDGNLYISDGWNNRIRKVDASGKISTIAGVAGPGSFSGDGSAATNAGLNVPFAIDTDSAGNIYFSDTGNLRIRKIDKDGIITTVANPIANIFGIALDNAGSLYVSEPNNHWIRKLY